MSVDLQEQPQTQRVRVIIADDDAFVRRALRGLLQAAGLIVIAEVDNERDAVELAVHYRPEIVLLEIPMSPTDGIEAARQIRERAPETRVIVLSNPEMDELALRALRAGAVGIISKDTNLDELPALLIQALEQGAVVSPAVTMRLIEQLRALPSGGLGMRPIKSSLSPREWEVLDLLCEGHTTQQIAAELFLVPDTVYSHIKSILRKLRVKSRRDAVAAAEHLRHPKTDAPPGRGAGRPRVR